jgi:hypothetical protein
MKPLFEYSETGKRWTWDFYMGPVFIIIIFAFFLAPCMFSGSYDDVASCIVPIATIILSLLALWQISILPVLSMKAYPDRIEITNRHGSYQVQKWVISSSDIGRLTFVDASPFEGIRFEDNVEYYMRVRIMKSFQIPIHAIAVRSHASAIFIESVSESWLIGLEEAEAVCDNLRRIYREKGLQGIPEASDGSPAIEIRRVPLKHFTPFCLQYYHYLILLWIFPMGLESSILGWPIWGQVPGYFLSAGYLIFTLVLPFAQDRVFLKPVVRAWRDHLELRERRSRGPLTRIEASQLRDFGTELVEDGDYSNIPEYTAGFRMTPLASTHEALTIITDTQKWAFDVPHPHEAAEALRKLYHLQPTPPVESGLA